VAEAILAHLPGVDEIERAEVAGPGFLNVFLSPAYCRAGLARILAEGARFGTDDEGRGQRAMVEFVSANPTGPLTLGHGRQGILGDCVARLFGAMGYETTREYYQQRGRQMRVLGDRSAPGTRGLRHGRRRPRTATRATTSGEIAAELAAGTGVARGRGPRGSLPAGRGGRHLRRHPADLERLGSRFDVH
jgi:arginyl-tRNA synthetase